MNVPDSKQTAARIGIGGPVGSGKTALVERLIPAFQDSGLEVAVVTNDLVTREDAERLKKGGLIEPGRVLAVETGACPHTAIREDPTLNIQCADELCAIYPGLSAVLLESGGDNLASTFSLELVDYWMFVIDVAGGGDIPRKKGPGVVKADLLIINKVDLAPFVGVDLEKMQSEAIDVRNGRPVIMTNCASGYGISEVMSQLQQDVLF
ncbi:MAG: urease accessory protein UreG [Bacteroidetes Order II. Incertae sedis bacterium]|jgi:urease accessory protein|nr:urease accessory protein UreG [Bacteroidetes Order II. bacterium]